MKKRNGPCVTTLELPEKLETMLRVVDGIAFQKSLLTLHRAFEAASSQLAGQEGHHA